MLSFFGSLIWILFFISCIAGDLFLIIRWLFCHGKKNCLNMNCPIRGKCSQAGITAEEKELERVRIQQLLDEFDN